MKIGLGTAQFGMPYSLAHREGPVPADEARRILARAQREGISVLDTAGAYGTAEQRLGDWLPEEHPFKIVTKLPSHWTREVYGVLVHSAEILLGRHGPGLWRDLEASDAEKIGVSIYTADELTELLDCYPLQIVQFPLNVLDQRLSEYVPWLKDAGIEVHVRSVFSQGALLMDPRILPEQFDAAQAKLVGFHTKAGHFGLTSLEAAVAYVRAQDPDVAIVGVTTEDQLAEITAATTELPSEWFAPFALNEDEIPTRPYGPLRPVA